MARNWAQESCREKMEDMWDDLPIGRVRIVILNV